MNETQPPPATPPRNPPGRPRKADAARLDGAFTLRLDRDCLELLDAIQTATGLPRSLAVRSVLHAALDEIRAGRFRLYGPGRDGKRVEITLPGMDGKTAVRKTAVPPTSL